MEATTYTDAAMEAPTHDEFSLTTVEARVLGCLIEKSIATPDLYPLTLNSLVLACNQKSNRHPVLNLCDVDVLPAIDELRYTHRLVIQCDTFGSRVPKYKHALGNRIVLDERSTVFLCELLLRGPQTVGEIRTHAARMLPMPDLQAIEQELDAMAAGSAPVVMKLPREPGRREPRYQHLLCGVPDLARLTGEAPAEPARQILSDRQRRIESLETAVTELTANLAALKTSFDEFRKQFE